MNAAMALIGSVDSFQLTMQVAEPAKNKNIDQLVDEYLSKAGVQDFSNWQDNDKEIFIQSIADIEYRDYALTIKALASCFKAKKSLPMENAGFKECFVSHVMWMFDLNKNKSENILSYEKMMHLQGLNPDNARCLFYKAFKTYVDEVFEFLNIDKSSVLKSMWSGAEYFNHEATVI